jgi:hypothetical protein
MSTVTIPIQIDDYYPPQPTDDGSVPSCVRQLVQLRARGMCEDCRVIRREDDDQWWWLGGTDEDLELHHLCYHSRGHEDPKDLLLLCRECHHSRHIGPRGEYYRDPMECRRAWQQDQLEYREDDDGIVPWELRRYQYDPRYLGWIISSRSEEIRRLVYEAITRGYLRW